VDHAAHVQEVMLQITMEDVYLSKRAQIVQVGVIILLELVHLVTLALLATLQLVLANQMSIVLRIA